MLENDLIQSEREKARKAEIILGFIKMLETGHRIQSEGACFEDYSTLCDLLHELGHEYFELTGEPYIPTLPPPPRNIWAPVAQHGLLYAELLAV